MIKMDHIAIVAQDADKTAATYRDMFGFEVTGTMEVPGGEAKAVTIAGGDITLEIFQPLKETGQFADFIRETGGGLHHISFATDDIVGDLKRFKAQGRTLQNEEPMGTPFGKIAFVAAGEENVIIELVERNS